MKTNPALSLSGTAAVVAATASLFLASLGAVVDAQALTSEDLASYGLTLDQFHSVRRSESPADFGGLSSKSDTDQLWTDALTYEYDMATFYASDVMSTSLAYQPYLVCSSSPDKSGIEREKEVNAMLTGTPGVDATDFYAQPNLYINNDTLSCGLMRAYNDTIAKVYAANPKAEELLRVNPLHPSMKMTENTVAAMETWFDEELVSDDVVSISGIPNENQIQVQVLGLHMVLCPGVQFFDEDGDGQMENVPNQQIEEDIKGFLTHDGGEAVADLSFYYHRVSGLDGDDALHTERMARWSTAIGNVTSWTQDDGSNKCLDVVIDQNMRFLVVEKVLDVSTSISFKEMQILAEELGFEEWQMEKCLWYMTYALALSRQVCSLEPRTRVRTLCKDGTSDLSQCPAPPAIENPEDPGQGSPGSRVGTSWVAYSGALVALASMGFAAA